MHQQARASDAGLPKSQENAGQHAVDGVVEVGVLKHQLGRLATEFQRHAFEVCRRSGSNALAAGVRTSERDLGHIGVFHQGRSDLSTQPGDHVDHAGRQACGFQHRRKLQR